MLQFAELWAKVIAIGFCVTVCFQVASAEPVLHSFNGGSGDGGVPQGPVTMDSAGNLFGTTQQGGGTGCNGYGCGTVFEIAPGRVEKVLYAFTDGNDGGYPYGNLVEDAAGNIYGTASFGGSGGYGTIFEISPGGSETTLHAFADGDDGAGPTQGLITDGKGNLFGTADAGGVYGAGTVFELTQAGAFSVLYSFCSKSNCSDGSYPHSSLIFDKAGNLYGTTYGGGNVGCNFGCGTVFELSPNGTETVLYAFCSLSGCADGAAPIGGVVSDKDGKLYGTTYTGGNGAHCGVSGMCGTVFALDQSGNERVLYSFCAKEYCADGSAPEAAPVVDAEGNLYGTTYSGDYGGFAGTVFKVSSAGKETVLVDFSKGIRGAYPLAPLIRHGGYLYGATSEGGKGEGERCGSISKTCGVVFKVRK